jgi:hypothetical protein
MDRWEVGNLIYAWIDLRLDWNLLTRRLPQLLRNHNQAVKLSVCLHLLVRAGCMVHSAGSN